MYGLVVYSQRRINYGAHNPEEAREIFIRDALVGGDFETRAPFFAHNHKLVKEIENLEHKSRRLDVLVDDELIAAFYDKLIPADVVNGAAFEKWHKDATRDNPKLLYLIRDELMRHEAAGVTTDLFPKTMLAAGLEMALTYHFEPGSLRDGVTLAVPLYALNQLSRERCEWLVPGMLKEKVHLLLKSLPQKLRRHCVPLPDYAAKFCERVQTTHAFGKGDLIDAIIADIRQQITITPLTSDFKPETLPAHHFMNFKVIDEHGRQLDMGRNLATLQAEYGMQARQSFQKMAETTAPAGVQPKAGTPGGTAASTVAAGVAGKAHGGIHGGASPTKGGAAPVDAAAPSPHTQITSWTFGELPELLEITQGKLTLIGFPALVDKGTHCDLEVFDDPSVAERTPGKAMAVGIALHQANIGWWNTVLNTLFCLSVMFMCGSGVVMWWKRRPAGRIGVPLYPQAYRIPRAIIGIAVVVAALFPLTGIGIVLFAIFDFLLPKRFKEAGYRSA